MLNEQLHRGAEHGDDYGGVKYAAVYQESGLPIAVVVVTRFDDIQIFVRKSKRRQGIGSKLIAHVRATLDKSILDRMDAGTGLLHGSREFWRANNVRLYD